MRVAVVFDTPYSGSSHPDYERQMQLQVAARKADLRFISYGHPMANAPAKMGIKHFDFIQRIVDAAVAI